MNHDPTETRLRELSWRRHLTPAEQAELHAWLAAHPDAAARWQEDAALDSLLERLPNAPVPSNFTARVLQEIEHDAARNDRETSPSRPWWQRVLVPRLAMAAVILGAGLFVYLRNDGLQPENFVTPLRSMSGTEAVLSVEVLQDFDAITKLGPNVQPDMELLSLMQ